MYVRWYDKVSNAVVNERTKLPDVPTLIADRRHSLFGHICRLPENTPASQTLQLSIEAHTGTPPTQWVTCHCSHRWLEAPAGSSTKKLAATSGRRHWPICWCCLDRGPGSFDVEDATTLSWSSAAVSEWVILRTVNCNRLHRYSSTDLYSTKLTTLTGVRGERLRLKWLDTHWSNR